MALSLSLRLLAAVCTCARLDAAFRGCARLSMVGRGWMRLLAVSRGWPRLAALASRVFVVARVVMCCVVMCSYGLLGVAMSRYVFMCWYVLLCGCVDAGCGFARGIVRGCDRIVVLVCCCVVLRLRVAARGCAWLFVFVCAPVHLPRVVVCGSVLFYFPA